MAKLNFALPEAEPLVDVRSFEQSDQQTTDQPTNRAGIKPDERALHFRIDGGKRNMQPPLEKAEWRKLVSVCLNNGENGFPDDWSASRQNGSCRRRWTT